MYYGGEFVGGCDIMKQMHTPPPGGGAKQGAPKPKSKSNGNNNHI